MSSCPAISTSLSRPTPFGSGINSRGYSAGKYRFGFNGKEEDGETVADAYDFGARIYDARLGRWLAVDPYFKLYPKWSPFEFALNIPTIIIDYDGRDLFVMVPGLKGDVNSNNTAMDFCNILSSGFDGLVKVTLEKNPVPVLTASGTTAANVYMVKMEVDNDAIKKAAIARLSPEDATNEAKVKAEEDNIRKSLMSNPNYKGLDAIINKPIINEKGKTVNQVMILEKDISFARIAAGHTPMALDMQDISGAGFVNGKNFSFALMMHEIAEEYGYITGYHRKDATKKKWGGIKDPYPPNHFDYGLNAQSIALGVDFSINDEWKERDGGVETGNGYISVTTYKKKLKNGKEYYDKQQYRINYTNQIFSNVIKYGESREITKSQFLKDQNNEFKRVKEGRR